jgi:hypothetical protein
MSNFCALSFSFQFFQYRTDKDIYTGVLGMLASENFWKLNEETE